MTAVQARDLAIIVRGCVEADGDLREQVRPWNDFVCGYGGKLPCPYQSQLVSRQAGKPFCNYKVQDIFKQGLGEKG